jgi:hypothetical protein
MFKIIFVFFFLMAGCSMDESDLFNESSQVSVEDSIREAVFRHQFEHNASGQQQTAQIYFIYVMTLDDSTGYWKNGYPGDALLNQFTYNVPPIRLFSECKYAISGVFDKESGERGLLFQVGEIKWNADDQVQVEGGYYEAGLSASGNTYYLKYIDGQWTVIRDVMHWIS